ncbi:tetratricopeptide repeat protein [Rhodopila sp.]|uniref:tetratricopeptide repeat-containing glycosyltransferase family protein n=1 Tax=Rhodopila sp. TaxID=2480087 RepID=UPI003D0DF3EA
MPAVLDDAPTQPPIAAAPIDHDRALYVQALLALRDGNADDAASLLTRALRRQPHHTGMRRNLVRALLVAQRFDQVVIHANAALSATPDDAELHFARATALNALGDHTRACAAFTRALALKPDHAACYLNLGNASADLDDLTTAETQYRTAIRLDPTLAEAHASLGHILTLQGQPDHAIEACQTAIRLRPDFAQAHWNLAIAALLAGDLTRGFTEYEWRRRHPRYRDRLHDLPERRWDGKNAAGETILVRAEQGYGDVIQFARYLPLIRDAGAHPVLACAPSLIPLMQSIPGVQAVSASDPLPPYDAWIDQISLPLLFATTLDTIPSAARYLHADPIRTAAWQTRLAANQAGSDHQPKIGLAFAGNPRHPADRARSIPPHFAAKLLATPGPNFVNLQHGPSAVTLGLPDLTPWLTDYAETAALIDALDLVITADTSVAHLAGALGKPVWILLPHAPDWRWLQARSDSPWYRSARLFRQPKAADWASVLDMVQRELPRDCAEQTRLSRSSRHGSDAARGYPDL